MKREESKSAIYCFPYHGPIFVDIFITDNCNKQDSCSNYNDGTTGYECHPIYKKSLYVNSDEPDHTNYFSVLDYEVYTHD